MSAYLEELRVQWRPLLAAIIGMSSGYSITNYVTSIMAPHMLTEFGWSKSEFAAIGSLGLISTLVFPFIGRLTDLIGVRKTALIGVLSFPISYTLLSMQNGDIRLYIALFLFMGIICITTTATVYSRMVVQYVTNARGLALAIVASGPAVMGVLAAPLLNNFVEAHGWRAGYVVMAVFSGAVGLFALAMMPKDRRDGAAPLPKTRAAREDYPEIFRNRAFWVLGGAMLLCNLPQVIALTQLNLVLLDNGVSAAGVSGMISAFAVGTLAGRFICGVALDRFPPHLVAACGMALSSMGLFLIASSLDAYPVVMLSILLIGLSFGAEGDLVSFLVVRAFGVRVYSSVMGMMTAIISVSASVGALVLGIMLKQTGTFSTFLTICGVAVLTGSLLFLLMPRGAATGDEVAA
ncbi:MFS transporter [Sphingobium sufflavum]|uniref:MFS transporter n=1 Tax=Sphingobium sufflavum TaxID=1129547 RepID=UPI001F392629|nr:MFS transporter [Sphingobium sufflavum]MCE7795317.1 MFS transporter [Sphingobium sufflavum]